MENEVWKDVKNYEGHYQISSFGNVYSFKTNKILKSSIGSLSRNKIGYLQTHLCINGKVTSRMIHRLVAEAFIPNPENKAEVNHINGDKLNNHADNLEWTTSKENHKHAYEIGAINDCGENNTRSVLTNQQVREIRALKDKLTQKEIAKIYNTCQPHISQIMLHKIYKNA